MDLARGEHRNGIAIHYDVDEILLLEAFDGGEFELVGGLHIHCVHLVHIVYHDQVIGAAKVDGDYRVCVAGCEV